MEKNKYYFSFFFLVIYCLTLSCCSDQKYVKPLYIYHSPQYDLINVMPTRDTIGFLLQKDTKNKILSINTFIQSNVAYVSFYDTKSESVNIYNLQSKELVKKIALENFFPKNDLYKPTAYSKNFDSIFVVNRNKLYLIDSTGTIKKFIDFIKENPESWSFFENGSPPVFKGNDLYTAVRPLVKENSLNALQSWKVLYEFNLKENSTKLYYHLPEMFHKSVYGFRFFSSSYCSNDKGNFVFSFVGDTNVYETNLIDYHMAYCGKSRFGSSVVKPVTKEDLLDNQAYNKYLTEDTYGNIYFDPYKERYLRVARERISEKEYKEQKWKKPQSLIVFNAQFEIIGENVIDSDIVLSDIFFSPDGKIYARTNGDDKQMLHFVRLIYSDQPN